MRPAGEKRRFNKNFAVKANKRPASIPAGMTKEKRFLSQVSAMGPNNAEEKEPMFNIETERLHIAEFTLDMAEDVHRNSLDDDNRRFVPDEVFDTTEEAAETLTFLISRYGGSEGPYVYPVLLKEGETNVGYVQLVPVEEGWEIGYHIAKAFTGKGYATEAVRAFLPAIMKERRLKQVLGICVRENAASRRVMEKCGFIKMYEGIGVYQEREINICRYLFTL